jgi:uridine kinase
MKNNIVIAISGASGAGKTTIVKQLAKKFNCPFLLFDHHTSQDSYPNDMKNWFESGANVSLIKTPKLVCALSELRANNASRYIFVEEPFGKERDAISLLIDYVVLLDQPLELCLARILRRHTEQSGSNASQSITNFLDKYEDHLREIYITAVNQVRSNSDLIVHEVMSIKETTNAISQWLISHAR